MVLPNEGLRPVTWQIFDMVRNLYWARGGAGTSSGTVSQARAGDDNPTAAVAGPGARTTPM